MTASDAKNQPVFGSLYRRGRESSDYQFDRMRKLCEFNAGIIDAYAGQIREQRRQGRTMWDAGRWHEKHSQQLEQALQESKEWIKQLEEAKEYLTKQLEKEKCNSKKIRAYLERYHNKSWWRLIRRFVKWR